MVVRAAVNGWESWGTGRERVARLRDCPLMTKGCHGWGTRRMWLGGDSSREVEPSTPPMTIEPS